MTEELKEECSRALDDAVKSGEEKQVLQALARSTKALMECQMKTARRTKNLERYFFVFATFITVAIFGNCEVATKLFSMIFKG